MPDYQPINATEACRQGYEPLAGPYYLASSYIGTAERRMLEAVLADMRRGGIDHVLALEWPGHEELVTVYRKPMAERSGLSAHEASRLSTL